MSNNTILEVKNLHKQFTSKGITVKAVTDVSFSVKEGETIGIVGESGCGKTTLGRCIVRAYQATSGEVQYTTSTGETLDFLKIDRKTMKEYRKEIQMIFQDPYSSLDPRMTVLDIIKEPIVANYPKMPKAEIEKKVMDIAAKVGLNTSYLKRYPHAFSGGQRQRIGTSAVCWPRPIPPPRWMSTIPITPSSSRFVTWPPMSMAPLSPLPAVCPPVLAAEPCACSPAALTLPWLPT